MLTFFRTNTEACGFSIINLNSNKSDNVAFYHYVVVVFVAKRLNIVNLFAHKNL